MKPRGRIQEEPEGFDPNYVGEITKAVHEGELTRDSTQLINADVAKPTGGVFPSAMQIQSVNNLHQHPGGSSMG